MTRRLRLRPVDAVPEMAAGTVSQAAAVTVEAWARYLLASLAIVELVTALPGLIGFGAVDVHDARHLGSFGVAVALGLLYVAWRPRRAAGILPIVAALAVTMLLGALIDVASGRISAVAEGHHLMELAGLLLVWVIAGRPRPSVHRRSSVGASPDSPRWRAV